MHGISKRLICIVTALCLLMAGMCPEKKADSDFLCVPAQQTGVDITIPQLLAQETALCTPEMLGVRVITYLEQNAGRRVISEKFGICGSFSLLFHLFAGIGLLFTVSFVILPNKNASIIILNYIHSKDGKK